jgi:hypothetical protein
MLNRYSCRHHRSRSGAADEARPGFHRHDLQGQDEGVNLDSIPCKIGNWADKLIQIWPIQQPVVDWPPKGTFTNGGPEGISYLMDRWRLGEETDIISSGKAHG